MQATIAVLQFPPRDYFSNLVSLLYRNGTWPFPLPYDRIWMQFPRAKRDLLIFPPSAWRPFPPDALYEPAKSTKLSFPILTSSFIPGALSLVSALTNKREWDLEDASLDPVAYFDRLAAPTFRRVASSTKEETCTSVAPSAWTPSFGSSLNSRFLSICN